MPLLARLTAPIRASWRTLVFFLKVLPMLPSRWLDPLTPRPVVERLAYPTRTSEAVGDLYRPAGHGPHPGIVVCLGVVPFGVDHPQVPRLGEALARSGFAALLSWSPAMRDLRLDPDDAAGIAGAYERLLAHPAVDATRSGLLGTCVGGAFALLAAAEPSIHARVRFVAAFAPYASMRSFAVAIASSTRQTADGPLRWQVDQLTRRVFVRSLTATLAPAEAERLRGDPLPADADTGDLSPAARLLLPLLGTPTPAEVEAALARLPAALQARLDLLSPLTVLADVHAPLLVIGHDRDDTVIPVDESRRLVAALAGRPGVRYTEFAMFQHADPTQRKLPPRELLRQLWRFYRYVEPIYRQAVTPGVSATRSRRGE